MERFLLIAALAAAASCSGWNEGWQVLAANDAYQRGAYQDALQSYLDLRAQQVARARMSYNIANVYRTLGENPSARILWERLDATGDAELAFRASFNLGNLYYERGMFQEAYRSFREALTHKPQDRDAKRNLELSLLRFQSVLNSTPEAGAARVGAGREGSRREAETLMEYIKRLEGNRWIGRTETDTSLEPNDW